MSSKLEQDFERAAEAVWNAEYLIVVAGQGFDEGAKNPFASDYCDVQLVSKPNKLMGFWGSIFNDSWDRSPHDGFTLLSRWRDRYFCADDIRRKQQKRRQEEETEPEKVIARFCVFTPLVTNMFQKAGVPQEEIFEPCGNVTLWQCSNLPPCSKLTPVDRSFRFVIDDATHEALPIKYVADKRDLVVPEETQVLNSDDEDILFMSRFEGQIPGDSRSAKEDRAAKIQRGFCAAGVRQIHRSLQFGCNPLSDQFVGFATSTKSKFSSPSTFPDAPPDEESMYLTTTATEEADSNPGDPCAEPVRCSHCYAHSEALCRDAFPKPIGTFFMADPKRFFSDRENFYYAVTQQKIFAADSHTLASRRAKYVRYNISLAIMADKSEDETRNMEDLDPSSILFFSNLPSRQTLTEPIKNRHHDVVRVNFPIDAEGLPTKSLPLKSTVSIVCETVRADAKPKTTPKDLSNNPFDHLCHVWQMVGSLSLGDVNQIAKENHDTKDVVEYILESRQRYVVHIAVRRIKPEFIVYVEVEIPCNEEIGSRSLIARCTEQSMPTLKTVSRTVTQAARPPIPTPNHILCSQCHCVARPYVLMNRPGSPKDEGFLLSLQAARTKGFKSWEKSMIEFLKQDQNKSVVILEVGCDKKMDVARAYAEKTFKLLKAGKCTFVRIAPSVFDAKKQSTEPNFIHIESGSVPGLTTIDRLLGERLKKK